MLSANSPKQFAANKVTSSEKLFSFCPRPQVLRSAFLKTPCKNSPFYAVTKFRNVCHGHDCKKVKVLHEITDFHFAKSRFSFRKVQNFVSQCTDFHFAKYRFSFRKVQIFISQCTDFRFAKYRFSFRKVQIFISQSTDFHFAKYRFSFRKVQISFRKVQISFRFVSFRKVPFRKVQ